MLHSIPTSELGPLGNRWRTPCPGASTCGFLKSRRLPDVPGTRAEMDSPRGRIVLMRRSSKGTCRGRQRSRNGSLPGCLACEPACPSGVPYRDLIRSVPGRSGGVARTGLRAADAGSRGTDLPYPTRFRVAVRLGQVAKRLGLPVPSAWRPMMDLIPASLPSGASSGPASVPARGVRRARVALLLDARNRCSRRTFMPRRWRC